MNIEFNNLQTKHFYDKKHQKMFIFKKKKKIFLLHQNIKTKQSSNKLNCRKLKLFKILKKIKTLNYKLKLSKHMKIHSIFHVSLIKKASQNVKTYASEVENKTEYEVKKILEQ